MLINKIVKPNYWPIYLLPVIFIFFHSALVKIPLNGVILLALTSNVKLRFQISFRLKSLSQSYSASIKSLVERISFRFKLHLRVNNTNLLMANIADIITPVCLRHTRTVAAITSQVIRVLMKTIVVVVRRVTHK